MMALGYYMTMEEIECTLVLDNGVLCNGLEVHGKHPHIFKRVLETLACGALGLEPTHMIVLGATTLDDSLGGV